MTDNNGTFEQDVQSSRFRKRIPCDFDMRTAGMILMRMHRNIREIAPLAGKADLEGRDERLLPSLCNQEITVPHPLSAH